MTADPAPVRVTDVGVERSAEVAEVLGAAFTDDPIFGWLVPDTRTRPRALRRFFTIEGRYRTLPLGGGVVATDGSGALTGATLALPPGHAGVSPWFQVRHGYAYASVFGRHLARAGGYQAAMGRVHPTVPHLYLLAIGVLPGAQGQGVATAMLAPLLRRCDEQGLPAYLEASSPRSARLYRRLGFVTDDVLRVDDAPPLELMTRQPR